MIKWQLISRSLIVTVMLVIIFTVGQTTIAAATNSLNTTQKEYQAALVTYRQDSAEFTRNKQLYLKNPAADYLANLLSSAQQLYHSRRDVLLAYLNYYQQLVATYITDDEIANNLTNQLEQMKQKIKTQNLQFNDITTWNRVESESAQLLSELNAIAYQSMAQIYYHELSFLVAYFNQLYDTQPDRILAESKTQVIKTENEKTLAQIGRALPVVTTNLTTLQPEASAVNSAVSYAALKTKLDSILATTKSNLILYANLE